MGNSKKNKTTDCSPSNPENKNEKTKISGWSKIISSLALVGALSSCGDFPNNEIIANPGTQTERFNIEYQYSGGGSGEPTIVDYNILVSKNGEIYEGQIEQKNGWFFKENKKIKSDNVDDLFQRISDELENEKISEGTRKNKDDKVARAKEIFNDSVLNHPNPSNEEIRIKYKKK